MQLGHLSLQNIRYNCILFLLLIWSIAAILGSKYGMEEGASLGVAVYQFYSSLAIVIGALVIIANNFEKLFSSKLNRIISIWILYILFSILIHADSLFFFTKQSQNVCFWAIIYMLFYISLVNSSGSKLEEQTKNVFLVILIVQMILFGYVRSNALTEMLGKARFVSSNTVFYVALLIPFICFVKKTWSRYLLFFITYAICLLSFKRSVLIFSTISLMVVFYFQNKSVGAKKVIYFGLGCLLLLGILLYIDNLLGSFILSRVEAIDEDGGSGRSEIWATVWGAFENKPILYQLFGSGADAVRIDKIAPNYVFGGYFSAHNDFFEILYDYGIVGCLIYFRLIYLLIKRVFFHKRIDSPYFIPLLLSILILVVMNMVSILVVSPTYVIYLAVIWAMSESYLYKRRFIGKQKLIQ